MIICLILALIEIGHLRMLVNQRVDYQFPNTHRLADIPKAHGTYPGEGASFAGLAIHLQCSNSNT